MVELSDKARKILGRAVSSGRFKDQTTAIDRALQLLEREIAAQSRIRPSELSQEEWSRWFREWAESHPPTGHFVDDSRDSIYSGTIDDPR